MNGLGTKLRMIRKERGLSLRQVQKLVENVARARGDTVNMVTASWLSRIERGHKISADTLSLLEDAYRVPHEELVEDQADQGREICFPESALANLPLAMRRWLASHDSPFLPPQSWAASFPVTTLLPIQPYGAVAQGQNGQRVIRVRGLLWGVIGATDHTLFPFVRPATFIEIDTGIRSVNRAKTFQTIHERPVYFLRVHSRDANGALAESFACGWCELDPKAQWLTLVPSALTSVPHQRWRYPQQVEVVGLVVRWLPRVGPLTIHRE